VEEAADPADPLHPALGEPPVRTSCGETVDSCPISGRKLRLGTGDGHHSGVRVESELVERIASSTGLAPGEAARVVEDVLAFYAEPIGDYVRRRHAHLKTFGAKNDQIFAGIAEELRHRLVAAPELTERQLRRLVYG
jgi:hypothetical protein